MTVKIFETCSSSLVYFLIGDLCPDSGGNCYPCKREPYRRIQGKISTRVFCKVFNIRMGQVRRKAEGLCYTSLRTKIQLSLGYNGISSDSLLSQTVSN